ncbi:HlyD family secretion protein [Rubripirellula obstinata]|nr:HlyD family efflux transporter periplasmic adaptor subunit [Rubripirellula obstinata]
MTTPTLTLDSNEKSSVFGDWPKTDNIAAPICLQWDGKLYEVLELDEYVFDVQSADLASRFNPDAAPETLHGLILSRSGETGDESNVINETIQIQFRPRRVDGDRVRVGFFDLSIQGREQLARIQSLLTGASKDELHNLSYDDLARGGAGGAKQNESKAAAPKAGTLKKMVAMFMLAASMLLVAGWVIYMVQSRSTVAVSNSVMMGGYMPVNSPQQAQLTEVLVKAGQVVHRGDTVARLSNDLAETELALVESKLQRAESELQAYQEEAKQLSETFKFTEMKVARDLSVAEAELNSANAQLAAANAQLSRLQPLIAKGNVALAEVDEAKAFIATAQAEKLRQAAVIETLKFAKEAARSKILVNENGASNPMGELKTKVALAEAACKELTQSREVLHQLAEPVELHAPADGTIYAIYRNEGETLKVADQMLAVSAEDGDWAIGHVAAHLAPEIRPGHPVEIEFPSLGITTTGTVEGIGHRAVYERGGYNADFRGGPLEVPIRVAIDLNGQPIPSGLRLNMTVRVKDHLKDLKSWVNEKIATYWDTEDSEKTVKVAMTK